MKERIVKDTILFSATTFFAKTVGFIRSFIVARFLGPSLYGLWNALSIISEYSRYSHLGVLNAMNREVPFYRGKKDDAKVARIRNLGFSMACIPPLIIGLILLLVSLFLEGRVGREVIMALRVIAILVFTRQLYDFFVLLFRSDNNFKFLSKIQVFLSITDILLVTCLIILFGFYGFLWAAVLNYILILGYIFYKVYHKYKLRFYFNKDLLTNLMKIGVLITLITIVISLRTTVDRLMIIKFLGITELGYFSISYVLIRFIFIIPSSLSQIMYPRLVERYGSSNKDTNALRNYVEISTLVLAYSMPFFIGMIFLLLPFGVRLLLPRYIPGIVAAQITILGLFFFSIETIAANFLVTINKMYRYLGFSIFAVVINFILDYIFLKAGFGINGVALAGVAITSFIYTSFVLGYVMFHYLKNGLKTVLYLVKIYFPFFYTLGILAILGYSGLHVFKQTVLFAILCMPLLWKLEKDTKAVSFVFGVIKDNIKRR